MFTEEHFISWVAIESLSAKWHYCWSDAETIGRSPALFLIRFGVACNWNIVTCPSGMNRVCITSACQTVTYSYNHVDPKAILINRASRKGADALCNLSTEAQFWKLTAPSPDGTNCVLSRSQISLNLGHLDDLAPFFKEKLLPEQYLTNVTRVNCCTNVCFRICYIAVVM